MPLSAGRPTSGACAGASPLTAAGRGVTLPGTGWKRSQTRTGRLAMKYRVLRKKPRLAAAIALVLVAALVPAVANPPAALAVPPPFNYGEALQKAIWFYEGEVSGVKPAWNRVSWRGNSFERDATIPGAGADLSGGFHDAGDHIKATFPMSHSMA